MVIMQLGGLATAAAQRGDDRAADVLRDAIELLVSDKDVADRETRRRRKDRERKPVGNPRIPRNPGKSEEDVEIQASPAPLFPPSRALPSLSPHPEDNNTAREAEKAETEHDELIERYAAMLHNAMGDTLFPDVDGFVKRRPYATWLGWLREMLSLVGPGSQFVPADLAQVCRDDAALDRRIGTPKGLRSFLGSVRAERVTAKQAPNGNGKPPVASSVASNRGALMYGKIRELITVTVDSGQAPHRMIPKTKVGQLGADVLKAYEQVGGAERFLNVAPSDVSFLIRDFSQALEAQSHGTA